MSQMRTAFLKSPLLLHPNLAPKFPFMRNMIAIMANIALQLKSLFPILFLVAIKSAQYIGNFLTCCPSLRKAPWIEKYTSDIPPGGLYRNCNLWTYPVGRKYKFAGAAVFPKCPNPSAGNIGVAFSASFVDSYSHMGGLYFVGLGNGPID